MIEIIPCQDRLDELVRFVTRLNSEAVHHIGFFGEGEANVRASLAECLIPPAEGFRLAYNGDSLVGVFGVDADTQVNRAWLFGPLIEHEDWHTIADQLYADVLPLIPVDIQDYDLFCDVQNVNLQAFAVRHGFPLHSENAILTLTLPDYKPSAKGQTKVTLYQERFFKQFEKLHHALFPKAYFTAQQIVERLDERHQLLLGVKANHLYGYHFCKIEPESESGYVDFIGTEAPARGRGIGATLLASGIDWMISAPTTQKISLTVNADNTSARHLYKKFGFKTDRVMRGYRKQVV